MNILDKTRLLQTSVLSGLMISFGGMAYAQVEQTPDAGEEFQEEEDQIVVTGSRIRRPDLNTSFPTLVVGQETFEKNAFTNIADALTQIPAFGTGTTPIGDQGGNIGTNFVDFLDLGSQRTLTLVNGRRFVSSNSNGTGAQVDFGVIPIGLIERVETIGVGGAPTYGSDAIAGTINVILKEDFEGFEATFQYGETEQGDADTQQYQFLVGANSPDGKGNVTFNAEFTRNAGLNQLDRPEVYFAEPRAELVSQGSSLFSDVALPSGADPEVFDRDGDGILDSVNRIINPNGESVNIQLFTPGGAVSPFGLFAPSAGFGDFGNGNFYVFNQNGNLETVQAGITPPSGIFRSIGGFDNDFFDRVTQVESPVERINFGSTFRYEFNDYIRFKGDFQFSNGKAIELSNQGGFQTFPFTGTSAAASFDVNNPFLTTQARDVLVNEIGLGEDGTFSLSRFNNDLLQGGEREREATLFRLAGGFEGDFELGGKEFYWDASAVVGQSNIETQTLLLNDRRFLLAVDAVTNPANGEIVCRATLDGTPDLVGNGLSATSADVSACVPLNLFGEGVQSAEALEYVTQRGITTDDINQSVFTANLGGELFELPAGAFQFSVGYEARQDEALFATGGAVEVGLGRGAATPDTGGRATTNEYRGEVYIPIVSDDMNIPLVQSLEAGAQIREIDNSQAGSFTAWTIEGTYKPVSDLTLRGNLTRSLRAPSLIELFSPVLTSFQFADDPCDERFIANGPNRAANCASIGIGGGFNSNVVGATAQGRSGGNPDLRNEAADGWTLGAIVQPRWIPGFTFQADYINIEIEGLIGARTLENNLETCFDAAPGDFPNGACGTFTRDANGQITDFLSGQLNADSAAYQFLNLRADYGFEVADLFNLVGSGDSSSDLGQFNIDLNAFHAIQRDVIVANVPADNTIGNFPDPRWSGTADFTYTNGGLRAFWRTIWQDRSLLSASGETFFADNDGQIVESLSGNFLHNASLAYDVSSLLPNYDKPLVVQANVNNVFDDRPGNGIRRAFGDFYTSEIFGRSYSLRVRAVF